MNGSATWIAWIAGRLRAAAGAVAVRAAAVLLGAGCVIWAALPPADKGYAGFALTVAIAGVAAGGLRLALTAVPVPEDSYLLSAGLRAWLTFLAVVWQVPWEEGALVAIVWLEVLHPNRPWHTAVLGAGLIAYLLVTHLAESDAALATLRPQARVLGLGAVLLALGAAAGMLPGAGPGAGSALLRLVAAGALIAAAGLVLPYVARRLPFLLGWHWMVRASRRPRTVLGCLVGRGWPLGRRGLPPPLWLPRGLAGPAVPAYALGCGRSRGSSPAADPLVSAGHAFSSAHPVAERTPADHHGGRVMAARGDRGCLLPEGGEPVLGAPPGCVGRVGRDHGQPRVRGHLGEPVAKLSSWQAGHHPAEAASLLAVRRARAATLASLPAGIGEVQVLNRDRVAAMLTGPADERGDGGAEPTVPLAGRQPSQRERDRDRQAGRVAVRHDDPRCQVPVVQVDGQHGVPPQVLQSGGWLGRDAPRRVQVPASPRGIEGDVVADGAGGGLRGDLAAAVGERHRAGQPVTAVRPVRQVR